MIDDPDDGQVTGIRLAAGGLTGGRAADADDPVAWLGTDGIDSHFLGAAIEDNLKMLVLEIRNPIRGYKWLDDLDDEHDQCASGI